MIRRSMRAGAVALSLMMYPAAAAGQEPDEEPPPRWSGSGELSLVSTSGNADTRTLGAGFEVEHQPGVWSLLSAGAFVRSEAEGLVNARSTTALVRATRDLAERLEGFGELDYLQNRFAGIAHRVAPQAGLAYELLADAPHSLRVLAGVGAVRELRLLSPDQSFASGNTGARYRWQITETAELSNDLGFTANLGDGADWRLRNTASIGAAITTILSLKLSHALNHLNRPVPGFERTDTTTSMALVVKFQQR